MGQIKAGVDTGISQKLQELSAATIDRMLSVRKKRMRLKARSVTKPGTLLKQKIPVRTFADWDDARPGFGDRHGRPRGRQPQQRICLDLKSHRRLLGVDETSGGQEQGPEVGFRGTGMISKQIALPSARPGLGQ